MLRSPTAGCAHRPATVVLLLQDLRYGGTQGQAVHLACGLDRRKFTPEVWLMASGDDMTGPLEQAGVVIRRLTDQWPVGPRSVVALWAALRRSPPDILMPLTAVPNIWGRPLGRLAGVRAIVGTCRSSALSRQHERWLWRVADHLICNSRDVCARLIGRYGVPKTRITVIPNGVDPARAWSPLPDHPAGPPILLSVARLVPDKDHATLVAAFVRVVERHASAELWIAGDGPERWRIEREGRRKGLGGRLRLLGSQGGVDSLLAKASVFVLSSRRESLPNAVLEAMAAGLPVVATHVGGVPELVEPGVTGYLVPPGDAAALAGKLVDLLDDPSRRLALGRAGRARALRDFTLRAMVSRTEAQLTALLGDETTAQDQTAPS